MRKRVNDEDRREIYELRKNGYKYIEISEKLGIPYQTVVGILIRHPDKVNERVCLVCNAVFIPHNDRHRCCTAGCRVRYNYEQRKKKKKENKMKAEQESAPVPEPVPEPKHHSTISELARLAREHGMSYGEYQAMLRGK